MIIKRQLGEKGQIAIPRDIREMLGLMEGKQVIFEVEDSGIKIRAEKSPDEVVEEFFNTPKLKKKLSASELKKFIYEQYDEEILNYSLV